MMWRPVVANAQGGVVAMALQMPDKVLIMERMPNYKNPIGPFD